MSSLSIWRAGLGAMLPECGHQRGIISGGQAISGGAEDCWSDYAARCPGSATAGPASLPPGLRLNGKQVGKTEKSRLHALIALCLLTAVRSEGLNAGLVVGGPEISVMSRLALGELGTLRPRGHLPSGVR